MKVALFRCSNQSCKNLWEAVFGDDVYYVDCPDCRQKATIPDNARRITGRCETCQRAWDDHTKGKCP